MDDSDVEIVDEHDDVGSGVGSADADVEEAAPVSEGELALGVDDVVADTVVVVEVAAGGGNSLGQGVVDGGRGGAVGQRMVCWKRSTLPQVVGWLGREFFWRTWRRRSSASKPLRPPLPPEKRVVKTMPLSVRVD